MMNEYQKRLAKELADVHTMDIIYAAGKCPGQSMEDLIRFTGYSGRRRKFTRIKEMEKAGLLKLEKRKEFNSWAIYLTDTGQVFYDLFTDVARKYEEQMEEGE